MTKHSYRLAIFRNITTYQALANASVVEESDMVLIVPKYPGRWSSVKGPLEEAMKQLGFNIEFRGIGGTA